MLVLSQKKTMYSVIIPAYNEEKWLHKSLNALQKAMSTIDMRGEIIVTDNNSSDKTSEVAQNYNAQVIFEPKNQISRARNTGAKIAKGQYLIFLDADTIISSEILQTALNNLKSGTCCGGGALVTADIFKGTYTQKILNFWTAIATKYQIAAGCFIYCLRDAFEDIYGFNEKLYASEEIWFSRSLKKWGGKHKMSFNLINSKIITSSRKLNHPIRLIIATAMAIILPFSIYSRTLCWFWYKRDS